MQIAVEIELEQRGRLVGRAGGLGALGFGKTQRAQVQRADERVEKAHRIFRADVLFERFGKQKALGTIQTAAMVHACQTVVAAGHSKR